MELTPHGMVLDVALVRDFCADDHELLGSLVELLAKTTPEQLRDVAASIEARDAGKLERAAHKLKGSVGNFAAERSAYWASILETCGRSGDLTGAPEAFEALQREVAALVDGLRAMVETE